MAQLGSSGISVPLVTLDALVAVGAIPVPTVTKVELEGAESRVRAGARSLLLSARPRLFLATHGWHQHETCWRYRSSLSYALSLRRDGASDGKYEVVAIRK